MANRWGYPDLGFGIGLRSVHFDHILKNSPAIDWFEALSENYLDTGGRPLHVLDRWRNVTQWFCMASRCRSVAPIRSISTIFGSSKL